MKMMRYNDDDRTRDYDHKQREVDDDLIYLYCVIVYQKRMNELYTKLQMCAAAFTITIR